MRDSVPSASYSSVCNVLRQWNISLIPTYRVYRLYDRVYRLYDIDSMIIGASLSEPLLDELAGAFLWYIYIFLWYIYIYIYLYPCAVHLVPRGPPVNALRANVRPAE